MLPCRVLLWILAAYHLTPFLIRPSEPCQKVEAMGHGTLAVPDNLTNHSALSSVYNVSNVNINMSANTTQTSVPVRYGGRVTVMFPYFSLHRGILFCVRYITKKWYTNYTDHLNQFTCIIDIIINGSFEEIKPVKL